MAHILCITSGLTGILNASFELSNRLITAGIRCTNASPANVREKVVAQGLEFLQLDPVNYDPAPIIPEYHGRLKKIKRFCHKITNVTQRRTSAIEALGMHAFLEKVEHNKPDLIIIDIELHEHIIASVSSGHNVLLLSQWFSTWNRAGLPPITQDIIPESGFKGSTLGLKISWWKIILQRWWIFSRKRVFSFNSDRRSILLKYAKEVGFYSKYIKENYWPGPFSYDKLPVMSMVFKELEFPHDVRPNHFYVGAMVNENRKESDLKSQIYKELNKIFSRQKNENKQLIYCTVSTFKEGDVSFIKKVIKAFENHSDWLLIITLGGLVEPESFDHIPENVYVFDKVPQLEVLSRANLSINHGGIHTINECIYFKVPMLIYSGKRSDQNGCAARVQHYGLGIMADKDKDGPREIELKINIVLADLSIQNRLDIKHELIQQYENENRLLKVLQSFLKNGTIDKKNSIEHLVAI